MRVDYKKLGQIAIDPGYRNQLAKDTSDVLANYLYMMSNLNADVNIWTASEMAMITNSLNRWQDRKTCIDHQPVSVGDILMIDFGLCYAPELSYSHPALVLEECHVCHSSNKLIFKTYSSLSPHRQSSR